MFNKRKVFIGTISILFILLISILIATNVYKTNVNSIFKEQLDRICETSIRNTYVESNYFSIDKSKADKFSKEKINEFYKKNRVTIDKICTIKNINFIYKTKQKGHLELTINVKGFNRLIVGETYTIDSEDYCISDNFVYITMDKSNFEKEIKEKDILTMPGGVLGIVREVNSKTFRLEMLKKDMDYMEESQIGI